MSALLSSPTGTSRPGGKLYLRGPSQTIKGGPNVAVDTAPPLPAHSFEPRDHYPAAIMRREPTVGRRRWPDTGGAAASEAHPVSGRGAPPRGRPAAPEPRAPKAV